MPTRPRTTARTLPTKTREEVVDARAAAPQPVEALDLERDGTSSADERQHVEVLRERRIALGDGDAAASLEAEE